MLSKTKYNKKTLKHCMFGRKFVFRKCFVRISFIGGWSRNTGRKQQTLQLVHFELVRGGVRTDKHYWLSKVLERERTWCYIIHVLENRMYVKTQTSKCLMWIKWTERECTNCCTAIISLVIYINTVKPGVRRVRDRMVVGFTATCAIIAYHH